MRKNNLRGLVASLILAGRMISIVPTSPLKEIRELDLEPYSEATLPTKIEADSGYTQTYYSI